MHMFFAAFSAFFAVCFNKPDENILMVVSDNHLQEMEYLMLVWFVSNLGNYFNTGVLSYCIK